MYYIFNKLLSGHPPLGLPCIQTENSLDLCQATLTAIIATEPIYEIYRLSGKKSKARNAKCMWEAVYTYTNGQCIPKEVARNELTKILAFNALNSKDVTSGYIKEGDIEAVYVIWKKTDCPGCHFFDVAMVQTDPPWGNSIYNIRGIWNI